MVIIINFNALHCTLKVYCQKIKKTHIHVQCPNPCLARDVGVAGVGSNPRENNSDSRSSFYPEQKLGLVTRLTRGPSPGIMNII